MKYLNVFAAGALFDVAISDFMMGRVGLGLVFMAVSLLNVTVVVTPVESH